MVVVLGATRLASPPLGRTPPAYARAVNSIPVATSVTIGNEGKSKTCLLLYPLHYDAVSYADIRWNCIDFMSLNLQQTRHQRARSQQCEKADGATASRLVFPQPSSPKTRASRRLRGFLVGGFFFTTFTQPSPYLNDCVLVLKSGCLSNTPTTSTSLSRLLGVFAALLQYQESEIACGMMGVAWRSHPSIRESDC